MCLETKIFTWLVLLQYFLYFHGLDPNLQGLWGMPVDQILKDNLECLKHVPVHTATFLLRPQHPFSSLCSCFRIQVSALDTHRSWVPAFQTDQRANPSWLAAILGLCESSPVLQSCLFPIKWDPVTSRKLLLSWLGEVASVKGLQSA